MINVEITRGAADNTMHVLRKFSRRVQSSGLIPHMRKSRYQQRALSDAKKKHSALHRIAKAEERVQLIKDGKMSEAPERGRRRPTFRMPNLDKPSSKPTAVPPTAKPEEKSE